MATDMRLWDIIRDIHDWTLAYYFICTADADFVTIVIINNVQQFYYDLVIQAASLYHHLSVNQCGTTRNKTFNHFGIRKTEVVISALIFFLYFRKYFLLPFPKWKTRYHMPIFNNKLYTFLLTNSPSLGLLKKNSLISGSRWIHKPSLLIWYVNNIFIILQLKYISIYIYLIKCEHVKSMLR